MRISEYVVLGILASGLICGSSLRAQEKAATEAVADSGVDAGATETVMEKVSESPWTLGVSLIGEYTDNRDSVPDSNPLYESNFDFLVQPRIGWGLKSPTQVLDFNYAPSLRYRTDPNDVQNDVEVYHDLGLNGEWSVNPNLKLRLREQFDYADDPSVETDGVTIRENRDYYLNRLEGGMNWRFSKWSDVDAYVRHMIKTYDENENLKDSDRESVEGGLALWRQVSRNVGVQGILKGQKYEYDQEDSLDRDFQSLLAAARAEVRLNPTLRGSLALGVQQIEYDDDSLDSDSGPYAELEMNGDALPVLHITGALTHGIREADVWPFSTQEYDQFRLRVSWDASDAIVLGCNGVYRMSTYDGEQRPSGTGTATPEASREGDETTIVASLDATYKLGENSAITLAQAYEDVDSDVDYSFTKNTTTLSFSASF